VSKQSVVESTCDRCHTSVEEPLTSGIKHGKYILPKGWLHVQGDTNSHTVFEVDLCEVCKLTVMEAAGKGRILRAVSDSA
jgi:hypothetical protein